MAAVTAVAPAPTSKSSGRRMQVYSSGSRARQHLEVGKTTHEASIAKPERSFSYTW
jgi:hypothetical protein